MRRWSIAADNVTILLDHLLPSSMSEMVKKQGKEEGGPWDCYDAGDFYGWEAERVVAWGNRYSSILEIITSACTHLAVILVNCYAETKEVKEQQFLQAEKKGLINHVHLGASNGNG